MNTIELSESNLKKLHRYTEKHKESKRIADLYTVLAYDDSKSENERKQFLKKADNIRNCNSSLILVQNTENQEQKLISLFCKERFCPICAYNNSLKHFKIFSQIVSDEKVKNCNWLFITLTIKNSVYIESDLLNSIINLKKATCTISKGFTRLIGNEKSYLRKHCLGMFRTTEITRNKKDGSFHPHLHILMCVDKNYSPNSKDWISLEDLKKHWQKACKLDYSPNVDIRFVKLSEKNHALAEVSKYQTKSANIINANTLYCLTRAFNHDRFRSYTGIIKELKKKYENELKSEKIDIKQILIDKSFAIQLLKFDFFKNCFRIDKKGMEKLEKDKEEREYIELLSESIIERSKENVC